MDTRPLRMLSGAEIVDRGRNVADCILPEIGTKEVTPNGSWLEAKQIQTALEARKALVSAERIDKFGALSHAEWRDPLRLAEVTQQVGGHWQYMGHNVNGTLFLLPEEALYLMETNCLLLKHNQVTVSLQKAYSLLLDNHMTLTQYKVYASLSRVGYKVFRHEKHKPTTPDAPMKADAKIVQKEKVVANMDASDSGHVNILPNIDLPPIWPLIPTDDSHSINESTLSSDQPLPPNGDISKKETLTSTAPPLPADDGIPNKSTILDQPQLPSNNDISKKECLMSIDPPLPADNGIPNKSTISDQPQLSSNGNISKKETLMSKSPPLPADDGTQNKSTELDQPQLPSNDNVSKEDALMSKGPPLPADDGIPNNSTESDQPQLPSNDNVSKEETLMSKGPPLPADDGIPNKSTILDQPQLPSNGDISKNESLSSDQATLLPDDTIKKSVNKEITMTCHPPLVPNKMSTISSDQLDLPPNDTIKSLVIQETAMSVDLPPPPDDNLNKGSEMSRDQLLLNGNKNFLLDNGNVTINGTGLVISDSEVFSVDERGVIRLVTQKLSADIEMETVSLSKSYFQSTKTDENNSKSTDSNKQIHLLNSYKVKQHKIKNRKIQPSDPKSIQDKFKEIPDFYNKQVVTVNVPSEEYLPRNIFLNNIAYVVDLKTLKDNRRRNSTPATSIGNRAMYPVRNSSESERAAIPQAIPPLLPNAPAILYQQPFGYYPNSNWRPRFQPFQRPVFPGHRFNQHPHFYRMSFMPPGFNARPIPPYQHHGQRKRRRPNIKNEHLQAIKNMAQRLKQFSTPNYVLRNSLISLMNRFNEIYNEKMQITLDFDVIGDIRKDETIELDADEIVTKKPKINSKKFDQCLDNVKMLAAHLKNIQRKSQPIAKQKRAFCNLLKNFNKVFDADFCLNAKGELIDNKLVIIDSSSDSDVVATDDIDTSKTKKRSAVGTCDDVNKNKKRKILRNPFSILKKINEGASTSQVVENIAVEKKSTDSLKCFDKNWLRDNDDFGKAAVCLKMDAQHLLNDSQQMYEFMDDPSAFESWTDLKLSFCVHMDAVFAFEHDLTAHSRNQTIDNSRLKPILQKESTDDWLTSLEKLRIIKTNTDVQETNLRVHFDVYNRDVQNFRKTDPPKPHFRIVCVDESSNFPSGAEVRALHTRHDDSINIVFAVVGGGSITYLQINPTDLPVYVGND